LDKKKKYIIKIDKDERIFELSTPLEYEKYKWEECLSNSLHYCKDIKNSVTKNPRNVNRFINILNGEGVCSLKISIEEEFHLIIKNNPM